MKLVMLDGKLYEVHPKKGGKILLTPTKFSLRPEVEGVMVSAREVTRNEGVVQDRRRTGAKEVWVRMSPEEAFRNHLHGDAECEVFYSAIVCHSL